MRHLVVGVDGSSGGDRALAWAAAEARLWAARLTVVHCYPVEPEPGTWTPELEAAALRAVDGFAARRAGALGAVHWGTEVRWSPSGSWAHNLIAAGAGADLLVVGSRGLGGFVQLLLGSVSHHVSVRADSSVAVVRGATDGAGGAGTGVVVGVDGSEASLEALRWAAREAGRRGAPLRAVHAYAVPTATVRTTGGGSAQGAARDRDRAHAAATELLAEAVRRASVTSDVKVEHHVAAGSPAGVLVGMTTPDDLLVCGQRGRGRLGQLLLGSVSDQCLRHASGTVVVVRPHRRRRSFSRARPAGTLPA